MVSVRLRYKKENVFTEKRWYKKLRIPLVLVLDEVDAGSNNEEAFGIQSLYFPKDTYTILISEKAPNGTTRGRLKAFNNIGNVCNSSDIIYSLISTDNSAAASSQVTIDSITGQIQILQQIYPDLIQGVKQYNVKAFCSTRSSIQTATTKMILKRSLEASKLPSKKRRLHEMLTKQCWPDTDYYFDIEENSEETSVYEFNSGKVGDFVMNYTLESNSGTDTYAEDHFTVVNEGDSQSLQLKTSLDREVRDGIELHLNCQISASNGDVLGNMKKIFTVNVIDIDDNPPIFDRTKTQFMSIYNLNDKIIITDKDIQDNQSYQIEYLGDAKDVIETVGFIGHCLDIINPTESTAFIFKYAAKSGKSLSSLTSFKVHFQDKDYIQTDSKSTNTAILTFHTTKTKQQLKTEEKVNQQAILYRNASKYSQVAVVNPSSTTNHTGTLNFSLVEGFPFLAITNLTGMIYVISPTELSDYNHSEIFLTVKIKSEVGVTHTVISIKVEGGPLSSGSSCNYGCSKSKEKQQCESDCGFGSAKSSCKWRHGLARLSPDYATCTPTAKTCPDQICDELEQLNQYICPQDCISDTPKGEAIRDRKTSRGIGRAKSPCWCEGVVVECWCGFHAPNGSVLFDTDDDNAAAAADDDDDDLFTTSTHKNPTVMRKTDQLLEVNETCDTSCRTTVATVTCIVIAFCILIGVWLIRKRRKKTSRTLKHVGSTVSMAAMPSDYVDEIERRPSYSSTQWSPSPKSQEVEVDINWEFPRERLLLEDTLGEGEFGQVVRGQAYGLGKEAGCTTVAVKMLKPDASGTEYQDLLSELNLLKEVQHPNVIRLLGACTQKGPFYVIVEFCEFGSLKNYLRKCKYRGRRSWNDKQHTQNGNHYENRTDVVLTTRDLLSFAWQTARGMEYLSLMKLVHRDLAARNVLVSTGRQLKISDFGLSRDVYEADTYLKMSKGRIPVKWMAPESLFAQIYTTKSDIWSFGVVVWEIVTLGANPYPGIPAERLFNLLKTGYRMDKPDDCPDELYAIMQKCWKAEPIDRPTFTALTHIIDRILQDRVGYIDVHSDMEYLTDDPNTNSEIEKNPWHKYEEGYGRISVFKPRVGRNQEETQLLCEDDINATKETSLYEEESESRKCLLRSYDGKAGEDVTSSTTSNVYSV